MCGAFGKCPKSAEKVPSERKSAQTKEKENEVQYDRNDKRRENEKGIIYYLCRYGVVTKKGKHFLGEALFFYLGKIGVNGRFSTIKYTSISTVLLQWA